MSTHPDTVAARLDRLNRFPPFVRAAGHLLQARRVEAGLTLADLAARVGSNHASISRLENGRYKSVPPLMERCTSALGLDHDAFVDEAFLSMSPDNQHDADRFVPPPLTRGPRQPQTESISGQVFQGAKAFVSSARALASSLEASGTQVTLSEFVDLLERVVDTDTMDHILDAVIAAIHTLTRTKS